MRLCVKFFFICFYQHQTERIEKQMTLYTYAEEWPICVLHKIDCVVLDAIYPIWFEKRRRKGDSIDLYAITDM